MKSKKEIKRQINILTELIEEFDQAIIDEVDIDKMVSMRSHAKTYADKRAILKWVLD